MGQFTCGLFGELLMEMVEGGNRPISMGTLIYRICNVRRRRKVPVPVIGQFPLQSDKRGFFLMDFLSQQYLV